MRAARRLAAAAPAPRQLRRAFSSAPTFKFREFADLERLTDTLLARLKPATLLVHDSSEGTSAHLQQIGALAEDCAGGLLVGSMDYANPDLVEIWQYWKEEQGQLGASLPTAVQLWPEEGTVHKALIPLDYPKLASSIPDAAMRWPALTHELLKQKGAFWDDEHWTWTPCDAAKEAGRGCQSIAQLFSGRGYRHCTRCGHPLRSALPPCANEKQTRDDE
jgi:hypothetical protein